MIKKTRNITDQKYTSKTFSSLQRFFSQYISKNEIIAVWVSGGPDSMFLSCALYNFFIQNNYSIKNLVFIHLNHGIRSESIQESELLQQRFHGTTLVICSRQKTLKKTENELRKRRYQMFLDTMNKYKIDKIFLGHHFDDRVETSMLNMIRGCWFDGFMWIKPKESHHLLEGKCVIRPLLNLRKTDILDACAKEKIPYVQDTTNQDSSVSKRNYMRNEVLPKLFAQEGFEQLFQKRYQKYDSQSSENLLQPITISPHRKAKSAYYLSKEKSTVQEKDILRILKQLHASSWVTRETLWEFVRFLHKGTTGWKYIQWVTVMIAHGKVYFFVASERFREKTVDNKTQITTLGKWERYPQKDDIFKGKTWNKYCITEKIPVFRRNFIPVVAKGNKIISRNKKQRKKETIF